MTFIAPQLRGTFSEASLFTQVAQLEGEVFREVPGRRTFRVMLSHKAYFAKVHYGVGWREILKNLVQLRLPVLGASNEWRAIQKLEALGVETLKAAAYVSQGINPARLHSCIVTEALDDTVSLEDLVKQNDLTVNLKRDLTEKIADVARVMHEGGLNHRDFYLCHFLLSMDSLRSDCVNHLHLIDLHRVQIRDKVAPRRWIEKDLAGLLFSAADAGLTKRDVYRFVCRYRQKSLGATLKQDAALWRQVITKANRLYLKDHGKQSSFLLGLLDRK